MKTAKLGVLFVVFVMAFTAVAASYAHWEETINISGYMETDDIDPYFDAACLESNDPPWDGTTYQPFEKIADPADCGYWDDSHNWHGYSTPERRDKNVGSCDIYVDQYNNDLLHIDIDDAYPCYYAHPLYCIKNAGSCPVQVYGVKLTHLSFYWWDTENNVMVEEEFDVDITLTVCKYYFIDYWQGTGGAWHVTVDGPFDSAPADRDKYDYFLHVTGDDLAYGTQLDPETWPGVGYPNTDCITPTFMLFGDLCIHFENGCRQLADYDFNIAITFYNWPEL